MIGPIFALALALSSNDTMPTLPADGIELWQGVQTGMTPAQVLATVKQCEPTPMALRFPETPVMFPLSCSTSLGGDAGHALVLVLQGGARAVTYSSDTVFTDHEKTKAVISKIVDELNSKYTTIEKCHDVVVEKIPTYTCRWGNGKAGVGLTVRYLLNGTDHIDAIYAPLPSQQTS